MKKSCYAVYIGAIMMMIFSLVMHLSNHNYGKLAYLALAVLVQLIFPLLVWKLKWKNSWAILMWQELFIVIAMILGNTLNGYAITGFDKVLHFSSGLLICSFVYLGYSYLRGCNKETRSSMFVLKCFFIQGVNMMIAFLWECFEFGCLIFLHIDAINHTTQGVFDTMTDMIVCFLGGCLFLFFLYREERKEMNNSLIHALVTFYQENIKKIS